ncbi:son of sevenless homolog 1-like [Anneissia japonica]|uniref:son of sevenless homolog 1-like n=2 Tax=Anneissia japonica TaxID=1529436 RepID=UPI0014255916|nr:son of sevenless homolog 1-like [Anneissia japonica]
MASAAEPESENHTQAPSKWNGQFLEGLKKVQKQVHQSLDITNDALKYVESLVIKLLTILLANEPHNVLEVNEQIQKTFPNPIDKWAIEEASIAIEKGKKKSNVLAPLDRTHTQLKETLGYKIDQQVTLYIIAILEYIAADILKLTGNYVKNIRRLDITDQDVKVAMYADKVLMDMFHHDEELSVSTLDDETPVRCETYDEIVKELVLEETQYIRDLNLIIKVFRGFISKQSKVAKEEVEAIFANILDVHECSMTLLGYLEDALEMVDENNPNPSIGDCFEELAEAAEFEVYSSYARDIMSKECRETLSRLLAKPHMLMYFETINHGFKDAVAYVLPKLLLEPIYHCYHYFETLKLLLKTSPNEEDKESLKQASGALMTVQTELERICVGGLPKRRSGGSFMRLQRRSAAKQASTERMNSIQKSIEGWEGKDICSVCNEFIMEGKLGKVGKRMTERHVYLFDAMMVCVKLNARRSVTSTAAEYRFKECYLIRKINVIDKEDTEEMKHCFQIGPRDQSPPVVFFAKSAEEKSNWMEALTTLSYRGTLERMLDSILAEEEKNQPLRLPSVSEYRFALEDSKLNIVFEEGQKSQAGVPVIKGGTLLKLIERLTYHTYADPSFVRTFLTTYRSFCTPHELMDLLIERFDIRDPVNPDQDKGSSDREKNHMREDLKRFKKEYAQPIQLRVLNVFRHWVDHHYYDFERDPTLHKRHSDFIITVKEKAMRKWVESIKKIVERRMEPNDLPREITFDREPPPIEWHLSRNVEDFGLMTLHPIEIARQLTVLESDLYRAVRPSELVGTVWMKKDKEVTSPNLLKMIRHSNMFTFWIEHCIVEAENFEERVAVVSRIIEILQVFQELNNFNGVLEIVSAMTSAAIYRLEHTNRELPPKKKLILEEAQELSANHYKKYTERLRSINPPCVPFFGMYLTNILKTEEGNPDFLPDSYDLINFSKRRRVAEITGEIQQYQNQPYCLMVEKNIRQFFENLNPLGNKTETEFQQYIYEKSLEIEPRSTQFNRLPKFPRKTTYPLKTPGVKPSRAHFDAPRIAPTPGRQRVSEKGRDSPSSPHTPTSPTSGASFDPSSSVHAFVDIPASGNSKSQVGQTPSTDPPPLPPRPPRNLPPLPPKPTTNRQPPPVPRKPSNSNGIPQLPPKTYMYTQSVNQNSGWRNIPLSPEIERRNIPNEPSSANRGWHMSNTFCAQQETLENFPRNLAGGTQHVSHSQQHLHPPSPPRSFRNSSGTHVAIHMTGHYNNEGSERRGYFHGPPTDNDRNPGPGV